VGNYVYFDYVRLAVGDRASGVLNATVDADALNCRRAPDTGYSSLGMFPGGSTVTVLGKNVNGWYFCYGKNTDGKTMLGWSSSDYLILEKKVIKPDVNQDNIVDVVDALLVLQHAIGQKSFTSQQKTMADMDQNGVVDAVDSLLVLQIAVGGK
jgi:uncharacterized protein YgiM (DUF1202 family)